MGPMVRTLLVLLVIGIGPGLAQDADDTDSPDPTPAGTLNPEPLPPLANPDAPGMAANQLFARKTLPLAGPPRSIGGYADGCLAGADTLPVTGPSWQVMRPTRNRNWGNPELITVIERIANKAKKLDWNGLLIGDMSQPRGGPMLSGHTSHQIGLDVDIWFKPMPDHVLSREEREFDGAVNMITKDRRSVDRRVWTPAHAAAVRAAAEDPMVTRVFINAVIKKEMCTAVGSDRTWLAKLRPWFGHSEHFHVRIGCPADSPDCKPQPALPAGDGCGHELDHWFKDAMLHPALRDPAKPRPSKTMAALPAVCRQVVKAP